MWFFLTKSLQTTGLEEPVVPPPTRMGAAAAWDRRPIGGYLLLKSMMVLMGLCRLAKD